MRAVNAAAGILVLGILAFALDTAAGILFAALMGKTVGGK